MPPGYPSSFKLCTIATLPPVSDALSPPVVGGDPSTSLYLVADPSRPRDSIVVDLDAVVLSGEVRHPPALKDVVMVFGELVPTDDRLPPPPNELAFLAVDPPDRARGTIVAHRVVTVELGHGDGLDVRAWNDTVQNLQQRTAATSPATTKCESLSLSQTSGIGLKALWN
ncbi:hypothetical protein JCM11491_006944 [Sporobolomyces phaffii]